MKNILSGIQDARGEEWVREQFYSYTTNFLLNVGSKNLRKEHRKFLPNFEESTIYQEYRVAVQTKTIPQRDNEEKPTAIFEQLQEVRNTLQTHKITHFHSAESPS